MTTARPKALLVAVRLPGVELHEFRGSLGELSRLVTTLGYEVVTEITQQREALAAAAVVGEGKLEQLCELTGGSGSTHNVPRNKDKARLRREARMQGDDVELDDDHDADDDADDDESPTEESPIALVAVDHELSPSQLRNLERATGTSVLDRTGVIIEIFHRHARSPKAKLEVELARLAYTAPRVRESPRGKERQQGRGAGEAAIELDRRKIRDRMAELRPCGRYRRSAALWHPRAKSDEGDTRGLRVTAYKIYLRTTQIGDSHIMRCGSHSYGHHGGHHRDHALWHAMRGGFGRGGFEHFAAALAEGRGQGRRRLFDGGELRLVLLRLIGDQPRHGYDLIRAIEERTGGAYAPSPGVVYPTLTMLGDMGQIEEAPSEGNRKIFAATAEGQSVLTEKAAEIAALMARLDAIGEARGRSDGVPVRRAIHNLRAVLMHKLQDADQETIQAAVALIDEAAGKIERL